LTGEVQKPNLEIEDRSLALFVDDTGHEAFNGQPFYGLGGCAALGRDIDHIIFRPWRELRRQVTGSPDTHLHASKFRNIAKPGDVEAIASFFRTQPFYRFGAVVTRKTRFTPELSVMKTLASALELRFNEIVAKTLCKRVYIVFESSQRADGLIQEAFQGLVIHRGTKLIPFDCFLMPKSAGNPALEVADFVMHAIGGQARHNLTDRGTFRSDFCAVFHSFAELASYSEVGAIVPTSREPQLQC
jgi:hypothetical protein